MKLCFIKKMYKNSQEESFKTSLTSIATVYAQSDASNYERFTDEIEHLLIYLVRKPNMDINWDCNARKILYALHLQGGGGCYAYFQCSTWCMFCAEIVERILVFTSFHIFNYLR